MNVCTINNIINFLQSVLYINVVIKMLWDCHQISHLRNISAILYVEKKVSQREGINSK